MMEHDFPLESARGQVIAARNAEIRRPQVKAFFDEPTFTASYVVSDPVTKRAAIVDSVWNFEQASGRTSFDSANEIIEYVGTEGLTVDWILHQIAGHHINHLLQLERV